MKRFLVSLAIGAVLVLPVAASADTMSDLQARLQTLLSQVNDVQAQIADLRSHATSTYGGGSGIGTTTRPFCRIFAHTLQQGSNDTATNGEVTSLQQILSQYPSFYPEGKVTGFFGPATANALIRLQQAWGIVGTSTSAGGWGLFGPRTRDFLARWCNGTLPWPDRGDRSIAAITVSTDAGSSIGQGSTLHILWQSTGAPDGASVALYLKKSDGTVVGPIAGSLEKSGVYAFRIPRDGEPRPMYACQQDSWNCGVGMGYVPAGSYKVAARLVAAPGNPSSTVLTSADSMAFAVVALPWVGGTSTTTTSGGGIATSTTDSTTLQPKVIVRANGSPNGATIISGSSAYIGWESTGVSSCTISSSPASNLSGSVATMAYAQSTGALTQTTVFTVSCTGTNGSASGSTTVTVASSTTGGACNLMCIVGSHCVVGTGGPSCVPNSTDSSTGFLNRGYACPQDVFQCPNGRYVSRQGAQCTFPSCTLGE